MRIVQVITGLSPAGAERVLSDLSRGLKAKGHDVLVVSLMPRPEASPIPLELEEAGIPVRCLKVTKSSPWKLFGLPEQLREFDPDIVHAHMFHANLASRLGAAGRKYRIVNTVHLVEPRLRKRWLLILDRLSRGRCDAYTAVSRGAARFHSRMVGVSPERIHVVLNGIAAPAPVDAETIADLRESWGVKDCDLVLGGVGRFAHQKGFDILLRLLPRIVPPDVRTGLVLLGDGPERRTLKTLAASLPRNITVSMPGYRPDAARAAGAFDILVVPSRYEGFGLVLAEGMAHGIGILASRIAPLPEVGEGYDRVRFVDWSQRGVEEIRDGLRSLMQDEVRKPFFPYNIETMVNGYLRIYEKLAAKPLESR